MTSDVIDRRRPKADTAGGVQSTKEISAMPRLYPAPYLRQGLLSNATTDAGLAAFLMLAAGLPSTRLGIPPAILLASGLTLFAFSILLGRLSLRDTVARRSVRVVIAFNVVFALGSLVALGAGWITPTRGGNALVLAQAAVAGMYAGLQHLGLRRSTQTGEVLA